MNLGITRSRISHAVLAVLVSGLATPWALAQNFTSSIPGPHTSLIDTTQFNVLTFSVKGGGGSGGGADSRSGGNGAGGSLVTGLVQVGSPYATVDITVAAGGTGAAGSAGGVPPGSGAGVGGAGNGAGGSGGGIYTSGGGGAGGGASSINIGTSMAVGSGGGGGGGGGSTGIVKRTGYSGAGMHADYRYSGPIDTTPQIVTANPSAGLIPPASSLTVTANCATPGASVNGQTNPGYPSIYRDGGGGGGNGGSFLGSPGSAPTSAALNGQDQYWTAEGGFTGASCSFGAVENTVLTVGAGGTGGAGSTQSGGLSTVGGPGEVVLTYSYDPKRVPTIGSIDPGTGVVVNTPETLPPGNTPQSYTVTCTSEDGPALVGSGPAGSVIPVAGMVPGVSYVCTAVAELQDDTNTPTIKTLPSPEFPILVPQVTANNDSATTPVGTPVTIDVAINDSAIGTTIDPTKTSVTTPPTKGTATANSDGTITYTPNPGSSGTDSFQYQTCDAQMHCATATVTVTIPGANVNAIAPVPTLGEWAIILLGLLTAGVGFFALPKRR